MYRSHTPRTPLRLFGFATIAWGAVHASSALAQYLPANTLDLTPANATISASVDVSGSQAAGYYGSADTAYQSQAVLWNGPDGAFTSLHPSYLASSAVRSVGGLVQGGYGSGPTTGNAFHGLLWSGTAASVVDVNPAWALRSFVNSVSPDGAQQVGQAVEFVNSASIVKAVLWNGTAASVLRLHPQNFDSSEALATDGVHQVGIGTPSSGTNTHALLWSGTAASVVDLNPAGFDTTYAYGVSGNLQAGYGSGSATANATHALLWNGTAASVQDLHPAGFANSFALAAKGPWQVGYATTDNTPNTAQAFLWTGTAASAVNLHALVPGSPTATVAKGIDIYGNIAGYATIAGINHAIVWFSGNTYRTPSPTGNWTDTANWTAGTPASGDNVHILATDGLSRSLSYNQTASGITLGTLLLDGTFGSSVTLTQSQGSLATAATTLGFAGNASIVHSGGSHASAGALTLGGGPGATGNYTISGSASLAAASLQLNAGAFTQSGGSATFAGPVNTQAGPGTRSISLSGGTLSAQSINLAAVTSLAWTAGTLRLTGTTAPVLTGVPSFSVPAAGTLISAHGIDLTTLTVNGKATFLPTGTLNGASSVTNLQVAGTSGAWTGTLDLADNALVLQSASPSEKAGKRANLVSQLVSGKNGGAWNGTGITSSTVAAHSVQTLALIDNADLGLTSFRGKTLNSNALLVVPALIGDANLDGNVDLADYDRWYKNVGTGTPYSFAAGDINMDGNIDLGDYDLWYKNVGASLSAITASATVVPEPSALTLLAMGAVSFLPRRRPKR